MIEQTEQIALLVQAADQLTSAVDNKMSDISAVAAAAILPIGVNVVKYYVNAVTGDDNNSGSNTASPFKTLDFALSIVEAPELRGKYITVYVEGGSDYHISQDHTFYHRYVYISSRQSVSRFNLYVDARLSGDYFGTYGVKLYQSALGVANANVYLPMYGDITGHNSSNSYVQSGLVTNTNSVRHLYMASCAVYSGDQPIISPTTGDITSLAMNSVTIGRRAGATVAPIDLYLGCPLQINLKSVLLSDGLLCKEGSLISGVKFVAGVPINLVSNLVFAEAI